MLKIRLQRVGKKNSPSYRVVLVEHTAPPKGKFLEILGFYNPQKKEKNFKKDRIEYWFSKGVQLSPTIHNLLVDEGILNKPKIKVWKPKRSKVESAVVSGEGGKKKEEPSVAPEGAMEDKEKPSEIKPAEAKVEEPKTEQPAPEALKVGEPKVEEPKPEESKSVDNLQ